MEKRTSVYLEQLDLDELRRASSALNMSMDTLLSTIIHHFLLNVKQEKIWNILPPV